MGYVTLIGNAVNAPWAIIEVDGSENKATQIEDYPDGISDVIANLGRVHGPASQDTLC